MIRWSTCHASSSVWYSFSDTTAVASGALVVMVRCHDWDASEVDSFVFDSDGTEVTSTDEKLACCGYYHAISASNVVIGESSPTVEGKKKDSSEGPPVSSNEV